MSHRKYIRRISRITFLTGFGLQAAFAAPWKFAVFGDGRTGGENGNTTGVNDVTIRALAAAVAKEKVKLVVFPGDLVNGNIKYGPLAQQFADWKESMAPLLAEKIPVYVVRGNHELATTQDTPPGTALAAWRAAFPNLPQNGPPGEEGLTYSVDFEDACFIACDQFIGKKPGFDTKVYDSTVNSGMISPWVIARIKESKARWVFVFGHESAFIGHHTDCLANVPAERDALWDALGEKGGVYLAGHDHMYVRQVAPDSANRPVLTLVVGDAGAPSQLYDNSGLNAQIGRKVVPRNFFVNAKPEAGEPVPGEKVEVGSGPKVANSGGHPMYCGYVLVTVDGPKLSGEWRALMNYDTKTAKGPAAPEVPKFKTLDRFTWPAK